MGSSPSPSREQSERLRLSTTPFLAFLLSFLHQYGHDHVLEEDILLWFAGKELMPGNALSSYLGSTESTTAIVRLMKKTQGAPSREPVPPLHALYLLPCTRSSTKTHTKA